MYIAVVSRYIHEIEKHINHNDIICNTSGIILLEDNRRP